MDTVRWGVIGAGGIARRRTIPEGILPARNVRLTAVQDVKPGLAQHVAKQFDVPRAYDSADELVEDDEVDAVYIAVPVYLHEELFSKAVEAGKHILIEKPLADTVKAAQRMADLVRDTDLKATEGYMMKFHPLHQHAQQRIAQGKLGKVVSIRGQLSCWFPPMGGNWRQIPEQGGGGALMDMATHVFDLMQFLVGEPIAEVLSFTGRLVHSYPVEDSSVTLVRFPGGCQGVVEAYFNVRDESVPRRLEIYGSEGAILAEGSIGQGGGMMREILLAESSGYDAAQKRAAEAGGFQEVKVAERNMYRAEIEYLTECILRDQKPVLNTLDEGVQIMRIVAAAYKSAKTGKCVKL
jgi:predicted dehydrogenase